MPQHHQCYKSTKRGKSALFIFQSGCSTKTHSLPYTQVNYWPLAPAQCFQMKRTIYSKSMYLTYTTPSPLTSPPNKTTTSKKELSFFSPAIQDLKQIDLIDVITGWSLSISICITYSAQTSNDNNRTTTKGIKMFFQLLESKIFLTQMYKWS